MPIEYAQDFAAWAFEQSELIRHKAFDEIDIEHLADEIESMGKSQRNALKSQLARLLQHILKWEYQPERQSRSWYLTIKDAQEEITENIAENPSLKTQLDRILPVSYRKAVNSASMETDLPLKTFPEQCPYTFEVALAFNSELADRF